MATVIENELSGIVQPILDRLEAYLIEVRIRGDQGTKIIEIFADTDAGITADQLAEISREMSREIDQRDLIPGRFRLEVSSPGLQRPLKLQRQYKKNIGREVKVIFLADGVKKIDTGILSEVSDAFIVLKKEDVPVSIRTDDVQEAYVLPRF
jgi:ribosome maturation factor RimP